ncbi:MAG: hypothetical protein ACRC2K_03515 [Clostridium sp.]
MLRGEKSKQKIISSSAKVLEQSGVLDNDLEVKSKKAFEIFEWYIMYYRATKDINVLGNLRLQLKNI